MLQKRKKQRVSSESSSEDGDVKGRYRFDKSTTMGNVSGTNIPCYSTVRQKFSMGPGRAPVFYLVECYSSRSNFEFLWVRNFKIAFSSGRQL
jgi:hypothetical protein